MIKWFDSKLMTGLPELTNTQGDLVKMLTGLLVNGANPKPITTVSHTNGVCTLTLGVGHGFVMHSVISIQGSKQAGFISRDFRINGISVDTISFDCPIAVIEETGLTVRYSPLGWTQHFASEGRSCYKSPDPRYPAYLRVDDTKFGATQAPAAKFACVEICADMTDFDTATWQAPYNTSFPTQNRAFITGRSNGWYKWYYSSAYVTNPDSEPSPTGVRDFVLMGDETNFWLVLYPYTGANANTAAVVGMPILDFGVNKKQALVSCNGYGLTSTNYPHQSFLTSNSDYAAPFLSKKGFSRGTFVEGTAYPVSSILLQSPVFFTAVDITPTLSSVFTGVGITPYTTSNSTVKSGDKLLKSVDVGQNKYSLVFDMGVM